MFIDKSTFTLNNGIKLFNSLIFCTMLIALFQSYRPIFVIPSILLVFIGGAALTMKTSFVDTVVRKPEYKDMAEISSDYILSNVLYEMPDDTFRLKLDPEAQYPVVLGFKGESNIGNFTDTNREIQPGETIEIIKESGDEMLKEETFTITYADDSTETIETKIDSPYDAVLFCKTPIYQSESILQPFKIKENLGDNI